MEKLTHKQAQRRYKRMIVPVMAIYLFVVFGGMWLLKTSETIPGWLGVTLAVLSALPIVVFLLLLKRYIEETDEYNRLQHLRALAWGGVCTVGAIMVAGFMQLYDVIGTVDVSWFGILYFVAYGLTYRMMGGKDCV